MENESPQNRESAIEIVPMESFLNLNDDFEPNIARYIKLSGRKLGITVGGIGKPRLEDSDLQKRLDKSIHLQGRNPTTLPQAIEYLNMSINFKSDSEIILTGLAKSVFQGNFIERTLEGKGNCLEQMLTLKYLQLSRYPETSFTIVKYGTREGKTLPVHFGGVISGDFPPVVHASVKFDIDRGLEEVVSQREFSKQYSDLTEGELAKARKGMADLFTVLRRYRKSTRNKEEVFVTVYGARPLSSRLFDEYVERKMGKLRK